MPYLNHLQTLGHITSWTAIQLYKATRLADIIFKLRQDGFTIISENVSEDGMNFARYHYKENK